MSLCFLIRRAQMHPIRQVHAVVIVTYLFVLSFGCVTTVAQAVPVVHVLGPPVNVTVTGDAIFNAATNLWEYRYELANTAAPPGGPDGIIFTLSEHPTHAGLHHEVGIIQGGPVPFLGFGYDNRVFGMPYPPAQPPTMSLHNYTWTEQIPRGGAITVGFDDIDPPDSQVWGAVRVAGPAANFVPAPMMPVPSEKVIGGLTPKSWIIIVVGAILIAIGVFILYRRSRRRHDNDKSSLG